MGSLDHPLPHKGSVDIELIQRSSLIGGWLRNPELVQVIREPCMSGEHPLEVPIFGYGNVEECEISFQLRGGLDIVTASAQETSHEKELLAEIVSRAGTIEDIPGIERDSKVPFVDKQPLPSVFPRRGIERTISARIVVESGE